MATKILIKHTQTGMMKTGAYGFSWTYLFFWSFVPFFRGEIGVGVLHLLLSAFLAFVGFFCCLLIVVAGGLNDGINLLILGAFLLASLLIFWAFQISMSFIYNKKYMKRMRTNGWEFAGTGYENLKAKAALNID